MSDQITVAIIPVRGGSRGIPRKNARLLAGKPLLAYTIEASLAAERIDRVYVSTDDDELFEIARRYGAQVIERPEHLAGDLIGLDEVVTDAITKIEQTESAVKQVVTIQATCPLINPHTIDLVCKTQIEKNYDTVLTIVDDTHLAWGCDENGEHFPLYEKRINRQLLPRQYRETGGVVACDRSILETGSRFGKNVAVVEISKTEAIDIDDYFDWWLAEKSLSRKKICFHVIGNPATGLGHVYRALTLADRLIDHDLQFVVNQESNLAVEIIKQRFYPVSVTESGKETQAILQNQPDLVINDVLNTEEEFIRELKQAGIAVMNFEDIGPGSINADCVINAMYDKHPARSDEMTLHGVEYCCLRDEFYSIQPHKMKKNVENIMVLFGGTDPNNLTSRCLKWIVELPTKAKVTVILGIGHPDPEKVKTISDRANMEVEVVCDTSIISRYMAQADIAITSAGRTVFELASLGIPMMVIAQNDRETHHVFARSSMGISYCGKADELKKEDFINTLKQLTQSDLLRKKMRQALLSSGIRDGINNTIQLIEQILTRTRK